MSAPEVLTSPEPDKAAAFCRTHLASRTVQLVGSCQIEYDGRAQSTLGLGERIVILKPDGTLLVHTAKGVKPVNYQPPGTSMAAAVVDTDQGEALVVTVERRSPREIVHITFDAVHVALAFPLRDWEDLQLLGSEADIAKLLATYPHLVEEGFTPSGAEVERRRGPIDLYGQDLLGNRVVVEVKRRTAGIKEATQLARYVEREREVHGMVRGILVSPGISPKASKYLADKGLEYRELDLDELLPRIARRAATQRSLSQFDDPDATKP